MSISSLAQLLSAIFWRIPLVSLEVISFPFRYNVPGPYRGAIYQSYFTSKLQGFLRRQRVSRRTLAGFDSYSNEGIVNT